MGDISFESVGPTGKCGWCGQPTDTIVARAYINSREIILYAHNDNNLEGLSCLQWIAFELDARNA